MRDRDRLDDGTSFLRKQGPKDGAEMPTSAWEPRELDVLHQEALQVADDAQRRKVALAAARAMSGYS